MLMNIKIVFFIPIVQALELSDGSVFSIWKDNGYFKFESKFNFFT